MMEPTKLTPGKEVKKVVPSKYPPRTCVFLPERIVEADMPLYRGNGRSKKRMRRRKEGRKEEAEVSNTLH